MGLFVVIMNIMGGPGLGLSIFHIETFLELGGYMDKWRVCDASGISGALLFCVALRWLLLHSPAPDVQRLIRFCLWWDLHFEWSISEIEGESLV